VALAVIGFAGSAQANTTLPGINGKLAFTTNADVFQVFPNETLAADRGALKCATFPFPSWAETTVIGGGFELPYNVLNCTAEIATISPDGSGFQQITSNAVQDDFPAWLPQDGSKLAFQSLQNEDGCSSGLSGQARGTAVCFWNVWSMSPDGTSQSQLTGLTNDIFQSEQPSYSPDGSTIAFEAFNNDIESGPSKRDVVSPDLQQLTHLGQKIYTMSSAGTTVGTPQSLVPTSETGFQGNTFVSDSQPSYSPDGSKIAFTRMTITDDTPPPPGAAPKQGELLLGLQSSIYTAPASGGPSTQVETTPKCDLTVPEIEFILGDLSTGAPLSRSSAGRGELNTDCLWDAAPAWSPDGSKIAVEQITFPSFFLGEAGAQTKQAIDGEDSDVVVFNSSDGSGEVDLSKVTEPANCNEVVKGEDCAFDQEPTWSPDGTKIAFFSDRGDDGLFPFGNCLEIIKGTLPTNCDDEIWTMNADGSSPVQVTNNTVNDIDPDWQRIPPPPPPPVQPTPPAAPATAPKVSVAGVRRACVAKAFHVRFRVSTSSSVKSVVVKLDGRRIKSTKKGSFTLSINGKKLKSGRHRLTITATDTNGKTTTTHKSFSVCKAAKPRRQAAPRFTG
jgi:Tol biopolymer transport system component